MALAGEFCSACRFVLHSGPGFDLEPYTNAYGWITPPGQTFDAFRDAAVNECVVCSTVWNATEKHGVAWSNTPAEAWKPLQYKAEGPRTEEPLVRLNVMYCDPLKHNELSDLRFRLVAINSEWNSCCPQLCCYCCCTAAPATDLTQARNTRNASCRPMRKAVHRQKPP